MMIIDSHVHMGHGHYMDDPIQSLIPVERVLKMAREAGVDKSIVFPVNYDEYSGAMKEVHEAVRKYPDELYGYARVNPDQPTALDTLRTAIEQYGFKGLKLHPGNDKWHVYTENVRKVLEKARDYGIPVLFDPVKELKDIFRWTKEYPDINFIIAHMGGFYAWKTMEECIQLVEGQKNVSLDTPFAMVQIMLKQAAERIPDRLIFGTDSPAIHPAVEIEKIRSLKLSKEVEEKILGGNIRRLIKV